MTTDTTSKISENPKKNKEIRHSDEDKKSKKGKWPSARTLWSCNYRLPPLGAAKENETEIFEISTLKTPKGSRYGGMKTYPRPNLAISTHLTDHYMEQVGNADCQFWKVIIWMQQPTSGIGKVCVGNSQKTLGLTRLTRTSLQNITEGFPKFPYIPILTNRSGSKCNHYAPLT